MGDWSVSKKNEMVGLVQIMDNLFSLYSCWMQ